MKQEKLVRTNVSYFNCDKVPGNYNLLNTEFIELYLCLTSANRPTHSGCVKQGRHNLKLSHRRHVYYWQ
jgi:hypothetical protein